MLFAVAVGLRRKAFQTGEEAAEAGLAAEMQAVGNLDGGLVGIAQQPRGLHEQHLVDVVHHRAARDLAHDAREVDGRDAELGGVEGDVVVLNVMLRQQAQEADEELLGALGGVALAGAASRYAISPSAGSLISTISDRKSVSLLIMSNLCLPVQRYAFVSYQV